MPPISQSTRLGAPTYQSSENAIASTTRVVPMSRSRMTRVAMAMTTGSSGTSRWTQSPSSFALRTSRSAPHSTSASLVTSLGWTWIGPTGIQRMAPCELWPTNGTSSSRANDAISMNVDENR